MSGRVNLDSPRAADRTDFRLSNPEVRSEPQAGAGQATSTVKSHDEEGWGDAADLSTLDVNEGVREVRIFPCLDSCLPACVVRYIEQLCVTVYNCFAYLMGREPIQMTLPDDEENGDDKGDAGTGSNADTINLATKAALQNLADHFSPVGDKQSAKQPAAAQRPPQGPLTMEELGAVLGLQSGTLSLQSESSSGATDALVVSAASANGTGSAQLPSDTGLGLGQLDQAINESSAREGAAYQQALAAKPADLSSRIDAFIEELDASIEELDASDARLKAALAAANARREAERSDAGADEGLGDENATVPFHLHSLFGSVQQQPAANANGTGSAPKPAEQQPERVSVEPKPDLKVEASKATKNGLQSAATFETTIQECNGKYLLAHGRVFLCEMDVAQSLWTKGVAIRIEDGSRLAEGWRRCTNREVQIGGICAVKEVGDLRSPELRGNEKSLDKNRNSRWDDDLYS